MKRIACFFLLLFIQLNLTVSYAHEVRPALLEIAETAPHHFSVLWKQPVLNGSRLKIDPVLPAECPMSAESLQLINSALVSRWTTECNLLSSVIMVSGLNRTLVDVYVRVESLDGSLYSTLLRAGNATVDLRNVDTMGTPNYLWLGIEHIAFGYDHLLFVLGLMLIVRIGQLVPTVTAFTLAHSLSLGLSTLADIELPATPVEIVIAMSIALVGLEGLHKIAGRQTLSIKHPYVIAFGFGLIHGFGFAGALAEIGLPAGEEVFALLFFNLGVELGQIAFIGALSALGWIIARISQPTLSTLRYSACYLVGITGVFWILERAFGEVSMI